MTQFILRETEKMIVHDVAEMDPKSFLDMILNNHKDNAIWCDGILLYIIPSPTTDAMVESMRDGKEEHLLAVYWTKQEKYVESIVGSGGIRINITKGSTDMLIGLTKCIKKGNFKEGNLA